MSTRFSLVTSSLNALADANNFITTTQSPQVFEFDNTELRRKYVLGFFEIESHTTTDVKFKINDDESEYFLDAGAVEEFDEVAIRKITITSDVGSKFRYHGLSNLYNTY